MAQCKPMAENRRKQDPQMEAASMINTFWSPKKQSKSTFTVSPVVKSTARNTEMYFREQNILFLEAAAHKVQDYSPQGTRDPGKPVLPALVPTVRATELHPSSVPVY